MAHVATRRATLAELLGIRSFSTRAIRHDEQAGLPRALAKPGASGAAAADRRSTVPMTDGGRAAPRASAAGAMALPPVVDRQKRYDGSRQQGSARVLRLFEPQPQPPTSAAGPGDAFETKEPE